ncbi:MAG: SoxR reducing system RseC family protein [Bacteroidales bacterium]|nr:SoxR reducing system RseC family protein [Bacteroidales bacterium]
MTDVITHTGIVERVATNLVQVRIVQTSACSGCSIKAHCSASETKEKLIDVVTHEWERYAIGEAVKLQGTVGMGMRSILWAFSIPFCVVVGVLFVAMKLTANEVLSATIAMCSLVPYYLSLFLKRNELRKKFSFTIEKLTNN